MDRLYQDRLGRPHAIKSDIPVRDRKGAWLVLVHKDRVLLNYPHYAPAVPDLPGGGIGTGESALDAARRELWEETTLSLNDPVVEKHYTQFVHFFADDVPEYWNYDQTFFLITTGLDDLFFDAKKTVPEGECEWIPISDLHRHHIHHMHRKALVNFRLI